MPRYCYWQVAMTAFQATPEYPLERYMVEYDPAIMDATETTTITRGTFPNTHSWNLSMTPLVDHNC